VLIAFNKPFGVLSQFTTEQSGQRTLADFGFPKNVYPIGRLDADSEGLLLLFAMPQADQPPWCPNEIDRDATCLVLQQCGPTISRAE
jgi:hypothetical protein